MKIFMDSGIDVFKGRICFMYSKVGYRSYWVKFRFFQSIEYNAVNMLKYFALLFFFTLTKENL